jgi:rare lipoprotein A
VGSLNRLYGGPYASRAEAMEAMRALPASLGFKPIVVQR